MSEVLRALKDMRQFHPNHADRKTAESAIAEIQVLQQQLQAAKAEIERAEHEVCVEIGNALGFDFNTADDDAQSPIDWIVAQVESIKADFVSSDFGNDGLRQRVEELGAQLSEAQAQLRWREYPAEKPDKPDLYFVWLYNPYQNLRFPDKAQWSQTSQTWINVGHCEVVKWLPIPSDIESSEGE